jgi:hypothetical protein
MASDLGEGAAAGQDARPQTGDDARAARWEDKAGVMPVSAVIE